VPRFQKGRAKTGGRKKSVSAALIYPDALDHLAGVVASKSPNVTAELKVRAAAALAQYQHPKPTAPKVETFTAPIDYARPASVEAARERILELGERLAKGEISVEIHDALVGGLRAYLGDKAVEQERLLAKLEADLGKGDA
jgi:hypothetical protein